MPCWLDEFRPDALLIELPSDLSDWLRYLGDTRTIAPVAISAVTDEGGMFFYPMADFSPELAAIRWASEHGIPVHACDLPVSLRSKQIDSAGELQDPLPDPLHDPLPDPPGDGSAAAQAETQGSELPARPEETIPTGLSWFERWMQDTGASDTADLWQRLIESPAVDADAEQLRRAALTLGWAMRLSNVSANESVPVRERLREAHMRETCRRVRAQLGDSARIAAVVGAFHTAALHSDEIEARTESDRQLLDLLGRPEHDAGVSLVPYTFEQLDSRSGYPAGVLDPMWHQRMFEVTAAVQRDQVVVEFATEVCREMRRDRQVAGTPDAIEMVRMMKDLASLRGLSSPGRGELIQAMESCLVQGDLLGRGRAVSLASARVLVGDRRGKVSPEVPRCGLAVSIEEDLSRLKLPTGKGDRLPIGENTARELRLDVLRKPRDRARAVVFRRLSRAGIPYAKRIDGGSIGHRENLVERWQVEWQQATPAAIENASRHGVTLQQVTEAIIGYGTRKSRYAGTQTQAAEALSQLQAACECGLPNLASRLLGQIDQGFLVSADLGELIAAMSLLVRLSASHFPGLPLDPDETFPPIVNLMSEVTPGTSVDSLLDACGDRLAGLGGSKELADVLMLGDLVQWFIGDLFRLFRAAGESTGCEDRSPDHEAAHPAEDRLLGWARHTLHHGSALMRGASAGVLALLGHRSADDIGSLSAGWLINANDRESRERLRQSVSGLATILLSAMQSAPEWLDGFEQAMIALDDDAFLQRAPALRQAFSPFSVADRQRLLDVRLAELDDSTPTHLSRPQPFASSGSVDSLDIGDSVRQRAADIAAGQALTRFFPDSSAIDGIPAGDDADTGMLEAVDDDAGTGMLEEVDDDAGTRAESLGERLSCGDISTADRWRLILGVTEPGHTRAAHAASSLDQLFGRARVGEGSRGDLARSRRGGREAPAPWSPAWSDELESLFGSDVCEDVYGVAAAAGNPAAIDFLDPDTVTPSVDLLRQVISLAGVSSEARLERLRVLARRITEELARRLAERLRPALTGLSTPRPSRRRHHRLNLDRTIRENLARVYHRDDGSRAIVAERLSFQSPARRQMDWHLTFVVDVSGSMSASVVYSALVAAILDGLPAITVRFLAFSTELIDFSDQVDDPLGLLLDVQVGGGTHIALGLRGARQGIKVPGRSLVILVSDFEEGVSIPEMLAEIRALVDAGVRCLGLASLDDDGQARYHQGMAAMAASAGMSVAAVGPEHLARWIGDQIRGR
ncbi:MAG: VWA containing CoxE family protein [Gammaproteobacteria bacterium]|nr:MAG: VWA containing CoxE family protein [Gammaproteobacteria bacterium]